MSKAKWIFLAVILCACAYFDIARNSSLVILFAGEDDGTMGYIVNSSSWICAAFVLALLPIALDTKAAHRAALLSGVFSVCAVLMSHYTSESQDAAQYGAKEFRYSEQERLNEELRACDALPASICSSVDVRQQIKINSEKLAQLESTATLKINEVTLMGFTINPPKLFTLICLLLVSVFIPYFSAEIARQLRESADRDEKQAKPTDLGMKNAENRPKSRDAGTKKRDAGTKTRKAKRIPNQKQIDKMVTVYNSLQSTGGGTGLKGKIKNSDIQKGSGVGNEEVSYFMDHKNGLRPNNIVSIGAKNDRSN